MQTEIIHGPGASAAQVTLAAGEKVTAEDGAMISMSADMGIETTTHARGKGGLGKGLKRMFGGESFFLNHFTAGAQGGNLTLATTLAGDMQVLDLEGHRIVVQSGSFVACDQGVEMDLGWQGFKSLFSGEGIFWLNLSGHGQTIVNSFGAIYPIDVNGEHIVDTGHIVAFEESLSFSLSKAGKSWISSFLGGEGLVCRFSGQGRVWCQSHQPQSFGYALGPLLRPRPS